MADCPILAAKALVADMVAPQINFESDSVRRALAKACTSKTRFRMCFPYNDLEGSQDFFAACHEPLQFAFPNLERRNWILMGGKDDDGVIWVGCGGHFMGTFVRPWLGIPPTGHLTHMRFHEFYRVDQGQIVEAHAIWDIPEVMMQAGVWPMAPSLGRELCIPGPATCDGVQNGSRDEKLSKDSYDHVISMLTDLIKYPSQPEDVMDMPRYWHERMNWYGPASTGSMRGHRGFRNWHQTPFVRAMPDRGQVKEGIKGHIFADNRYVGVTGWPNMRQTLSHDGWYGIPPLGRTVDMRSLDFWRLEPCEDGQQRIRENWVMWDVLDVYNQIGVDIFGRMKEMARPFERRVPDEVWRIK